MKPPFIENWGQIGILFPMRRTLIIGAGATLIVLLLIAGAAYAYFNRASTFPTPDTASSTPSGSVSNAEDQAVRTVVTEFGTKLKQVSLLAPTAQRAAAMASAYSPYVAPELLATWQKEGSTALGRYTSSPAPDSITIVTVRPNGTQYVVEGNVIEKTSATNEPAAIYPVTLTLEKRGDRWMIVAATKGAYSEIPHRQSIVGFWECLPHKDTSGPQTMECAFGIAVDQSDGHFAVDTSLMSTYPVDYATGTKVRVTGIVTPANQLSSPQRYDIDGIIRATTIEKL